MEFKDKTSVFTSDGKSGGSLHRVVIEPEKNEVTHIVVQSGLLVKEDKVVPVVNIASANQEKVTLDCTVDQLKEMAPLEIEQQIPMSETSGRGGSFDPLTGGMVLTPTLVTQTKRSIPEELVALKEGAQVISEDNKHVGNLDCVLTEPKSVNITHLIVSQGFLTKIRKLVPIQWVKMLDDDKVRLAVGARDWEVLPPVPDWGASWE